MGEAYEKRLFEAHHDAQRLQLLFEQAVDRLLRPERDEDEAFAAGHHGTVALRRVVIWAKLDLSADAILTSAEARLDEIERMKGGKVKPKRRSRKR